VRYSRFTLCAALALMVAAPAVAAGVVMLRRI
jgi:hypothetical protein